MRKLAFALASTLALTACKTEEKNSAHEGLSKEEIAAQVQAESDARMQSRLDQYLIDIADIPVTRNGQSFTLDTQAFCNSVPQDNIESYTATCTQNAVKELQTQFACAGYSIPTAMVRTTNEDIIKASIQGAYDSSYLYTTEKLKRAIAQNDASIFKEDFLILTDASDMAALEETYIRQGDKPDYCPS